MKIVDAFMFYNEFDMLIYRLNTLKDIIDYFVIVESTMTHVGNKKPLYYELVERDIDTVIRDKIIYILCDKMESNLESKVDPWRNEAIQRNFIDEGIKKIDSLKDDDLIIISDIDEIPDRNILENIKRGIIDFPDTFCNIEQDMYYYNLRTINNNKWYYSKIVRYKNYVLNFERSPQKIRYSMSIYNLVNCGWHLSYFGDIKYIKNKLVNFCHQEFNTDLYTNEDYIKSKIDNNSDLFSRDTDVFKRIEICDNKYLPYEYDKFLIKYI